MFKIVLSAEGMVCRTMDEARLAESTQAKHSILFALLHSLGVPGAIAAEDACAMEHNLSPESYEALKQLVQERQLAI